MIGANKLALGVDIGGVITDMPKGVHLSYFSDAHLKIETKPGAFEALRRLVDEKYGDNVFVISKCSDIIQEKTEEWLRHHGFCEKTGIKWENIIFCYHNSHKADLCKSRNITTAFVDNRWEVIKYLRASIKSLHLFMPDEEEMLKYGGFEKSNNIEIRGSWAEVLKAELS